MSEVMHEIILISGREVLGDEQSEQLLIDSVSNWDFVTPEELGILRTMQYSYGFAILERNPPRMSGKQPLRTPRDYINQYYEERKAALEKVEKRKKQTEQEKLEKKRKQLERLKKELGDV